MMSEGRSCSRSARACQCVFLTFVTVYAYVDAQQCVPNSRALTVHTYVYVHILALVCSTIVIVVVVLGVVATLVVCILLCILSTTS